MPSRQRRSDAAASIGKIIAAAREAFARDESTTLSEIAEAAGVADVTLYRHFPNRTALAHAVYADLFDADIRPTVFAFDIDTPRATFLDALHRLGDAMCQQRTLLATLDDLAGRTLALMMRDRAELETVITRAQTAGLLRPDVSTEDVATFAAMVLTGSVAMSHSPRERRRYLSLMFDALSPATAQPLSDDHHSG